MFDNSSIVVGLEIGTSKVCAVVGEMGPGGALHIVGLGQAPSRGVRKGEILDTGAAEEDVRNAIVQAEQMADVEIRSVFLGVTGAHIRGFNNRGTHNVVSNDREITEDDVQDVLRNAKTVNLPADSHAIHTVRQHFIIDGREGLVRPSGMLGSKMEVDVHIVQGNLNRLQNAIRTVKGLQLEVDDIVFNGLASSLALLTPEQRELGAVVIDIGAGTTEYVAYANGIVKHTGVLAVGGDHISNDLAYGLKVPLSRAEAIKLEHGSALVDESVKGQTLTIANDLGLPTRSINLEHVRRIMSLRIEEILQLVGQELEQVGVLDYLRAGAFLCGGVSRTPQLGALAEQVLQMPVTLGKSNSISGLRSALDQPEFATPIGLAKFGSNQQRKREAKSAFGDGIRSTFAQFFKRT